MTTPSMEDVHMMSRIKSLLLLCIGMIGGGQLDAIPPTTVFRPYDVMFRIAPFDKMSAAIGAHVEWASTNHAMNAQGERVPLFSLYTPTQSTIAMLLGSQPGSPDFDTLTSIFGNPVMATIDGRRGEISLSGRYDEVSTTIWANYNILGLLPGTVYVTGYLPFKRIEISDLRIRDCTRGVDPADLEVKERITNRLTEFLAERCLFLNNFQQLGLADVTGMLGWWMNFKQARDYLRNVHVDVKVGLSIPTSIRRDEDHPLTLPFGNDGAWAIPLGGELQLDFIHRITFGVAVDVTIFSNSTRIRRLKTDRAQTDFFIPQKSMATLSQGPMWRFGLMLLGYDIGHSGVSLAGMYHFSKHDSGSLYAESNAFNYDIINSMGRLQEWSHHMFTLRLGYDYLRNEKRSWIPSAAFFARVPLFGRRFIEAPTLGGQLSVRF